MLCEIIKIMSQKSSMCITISITDRHLGLLTTFAQSTDKWKEGQTGLAYYNLYYKCNESLVTV